MCYGFVNWVMILVLDSNFACVCRVTLLIEQDVPNRQLHFVFTAVTRMAFVLEAKALLVSS